LFLVFVSVLSSDIDLYSPVMNAPSYRPAPSFLPQ
jgi:hypothetical protein